MIKIYKNYLDVESFIWPECKGPLKPLPGWPEGKIDDKKVNVERIDTQPKYDWLQNKILRTFIEYGDERRYKIHSVISMRCSELGPDASLPWHIDNYYNGVDDRILSMTIEVQNAERGGGLELDTFMTPRIIRLEPGDAIIFNATERHRSIRVMEGTRKIITAFAGGIKL